MMRKTLKMKMMMIMMTRMANPRDPDQNMTQSRIATSQDVEEARYLRKFVILPIQTRKNANNSE